MISEYDAVKKILDSNHVTDIDDIEYGGECFDELMDYFADEMPYGVKKARTGMPDEWIYDKLIDLGFDKEEEFNGWASQMNRKRKFKVSKKEDEWKFSKWDGPPYSYSVKVNGKLKRMSGFDVEHIQHQLYPRKATMIRKVKDEE